MLNVKKNFWLKKVTAALTALSFIFSIFSPAIQAAPAAPINRTVTSSAALAPNNFVVAFNIGKVTDSVNFNSQRAIVQIQDLHSHREVQRNIAGILSALDGKYKIGKIYVEGAFGEIDASLLYDIGNKDIRDAIVNSLIDNGILTGAEFFSITSGKTKILSGLEDKDAYLGNFNRLLRIYAQREEIQSLMPQVKEFLNYITKDYYCNENKKINRIIDKYKNGEIPFERYFAYIVEKAQKQNVYFGFYPSITLFSEIIRLQKRLDTQKVNGQIQSLLDELKSKISYSKYKELTDCYGKPETQGLFYFKLAEYVNEFKYASKYKELGKFLDFISANQRINPIDLVSQERALLWEIKNGAAKNEKEKEAIFLNCFFDLMQAFLDNKISAPEYKYFQRELGRFKTLWTKYTRMRAMPGISKYYDLFENFYRVNEDRNKIFVKEINGKLPKESKAALTLPKGAVMTDAAGILEKAEEIDVVITGGFHTQEVSRILQKAGQSYVVITPNVTEDAAEADKLYEQDVMRVSAYIQSSAFQKPLFIMALGIALSNKNNLEAIAEALKVLLDEQAFQTSELKELADGINKMLEARGSKISIELEGNNLTVKANDGRLIRRPLADEKKAEAAKPKRASLSKNKAEAMREFYKTLDNYTALPNDETGTALAKAISKVEKLKITQDELLEDVKRARQEIDLENNEIDALLKDSDFALKAAQAANDAYNESARTNYPLYDENSADEKVSNVLTNKEQATAVNIAGFYALETAIGALLSQSAEVLSVSEILDDIINDKITPQQQELLMRFANATWKAGQYFRSPSRITRANFTTWDSLSRDERLKDMVQIKAAAKLLKNELEGVPAQNQTEKLNALLKDSDFALKAAQAANDAYNESAGTNYPLYDENSADEKVSNALTNKEQATAVNIAGFYALETAIGALLSQSAEVLSVSEILDDIINGKVTPQQQELLMRFANATWKAGQYFRSPSRITRANFTTWDSLSRDERLKDMVQIKAAAKLLKNELDDKKQKGIAALTKDSTKEAYERFISQFGRLGREFLKTGVSGFILRVFVAPLREKSDLMKIAKAEKKAQEYIRLAENSSDENEINEYLRLARENRIRIAEFLNAHKGYVESSDEFLGNVASDYDRGLQGIIAATNDAYERVLSLTKIKWIANLAAAIANVIIHARWNIGNLQTPLVRDFDKDSADANEELIKELESRGIKVDRAAIRGRLLQISVDLSEFPALANNFKNAAPISLKEQVELIDSDDEFDAIAMAINEKNNKLFIGDAIDSKRLTKRLQLLKRQFERLYPEVVFSEQQSLIKELESKGIKINRVKASGDKYTRIEIDVANFPDFLSNLSIKAGFADFDDYDDIGIAVDDAGSKLLVGGRNDDSKFTDNLKMLKRLFEETYPQTPAVAVEQPQELSEDKKAAKTNFQEAINAFNAYLYANLDFFLNNKANENTLKGIIFESLYNSIVEYNNLINSDYGKERDIFFDCDEYREFIINVNILKGVIFYKNIDFQSFETSNLQSPSVNHLNLLAQLRRNLITNKPAIGIRGYQYGAVLYRLDEIIADNLDKMKDDYFVDDEKIYFQIISNRANAQYLTKFIADKNNDLNRRLFAFMYFAKNFQSAQGIDVESLRQEFAQAVRNNKVGEAANNYDLKAIVTGVHLILAGTNIFKEQEFQPDIWNRISNSILLGKNGRAMANALMQFVSVGLETIAHELGHNYLSNIAQKFNIKGKVKYETFMEKVIDELFAFITSGLFAFITDRSKINEKDYDNEEIFLKLARGEGELEEDRHDQYNAVRGILNYLNIALRQGNKVFGWERFANAIILLLRNEAGSTIFNEKDGLKPFFQRVVARYAQTTETINAINVFGMRKEEDVVDILLSNNAEGIRQYLLGEDWIPIGEVVKSLFKDPTFLSYIANDNLPLAADYISKNFKDKLPPMFQKDDSLLTFAQWLQKKFNDIILNMENDVTNGVVEADVLIEALTAARQGNTIKFKTLALRYISVISDEMLNKLIESFSGFYNEYLERQRQEDLLLNAQINIELPIDISTPEKLLNEYLRAIEIGKTEGYQKGALVDLRGSGKEVIMIGDLHARTDNLEAILAAKDANGISAQERIKNGSAVLVFLGDAVHNEKDLGEMDSSWEIMQRIMKLKIDNPKNVYYILGNHDTLNPAIAKGNVRQGLLYNKYLEDKISKEAYRMYEEAINNNALAAVGDNFVAVHAGPANKKARKEANAIDFFANTRFSSLLEDYRQKEKKYIEENDIIYQLLWNRVSQDPRRSSYDKEDVDNFLQAFGVSAEDGVLIVGHSPREILSLKKNAVWRGEVFDNHHIIVAEQDRFGFLNIAPNGNKKFVEVYRDSTVEETEFGKQSGNITNQPQADDNANIIPAQPQRRTRNNSNDIVRSNIYNKQDTSLWLTDNQVEEVRDILKSSKENGWSADKAFDALERFGYIAVTPFNLSEGNRAAFYDKLYEEIAALDDIGPSSKSGPNSILDRLFKNKTSLFYRIYSAFIAPLWEEWLFRGIIPIAITSLFGIGLPAALAISGILFMLAHYNKDFTSKDWLTLAAMTLLYSLAVFPLFDLPIVGCFMQIFYAATGYSALSIFAHMVYNGLVVDKIIKKLRIHSIIESLVKNNESAIEKDYPRLKGKSSVMIAPANSSQTIESLVSVSKERADFGMDVRIIAPKSMISNLEEDGFNDIENTGTQHIAKKVIINENGARIYVYVYYGNEQIKADYAFDAFKWLATEIGTDNIAMLELDEKAEQIDETKRMQWEQANAKAVTYYADGANIKSRFKAAADKQKTNRNGKNMKNGKILSTTFGVSELSKEAFSSKEFASFDTFVAEASVQELKEESKKIRDFIKSGRENAKEVIIRVKADNKSQAQEALRFNYKQLRSNIKKNAIGEIGVSGVILDFTSITEKDMADLSSYARQFYLNVKAENGDAVAAVETKHYERFRASAIENFSDVAAVEIGKDETINANTVDEEEISKALDEAMNTDKRMVIIRGNVVSSLKEAGVFVDSLAFLSGKVKRWIDKWALTPQGSFRKGKKAGLLNGREKIKEGDENPYKLLKEMREIAQDGKDFSKLSERERKKAEELLREIDKIFSSSYEARFNASSDAKQKELIFNETQGFLQGVLESIEAESPYLKDKAFAISADEDIIRIALVEAKIEGLKNKEDIKEWQDREYIKPVDTLIKSMSADISVRETFNLISEYTDNDYKNDENRAENKKIALAKLIEMLPVLYKTDTRIEPLGHTDAMIDGVQAMLRAA